MTATFDRDKARRVLRQMYSGDDLLDALAACVVPDPNEPYWNIRAERDRAKLAAIALHCSENPGHLDLNPVRRILRKTDS